jgi:hypothetical protein
MTMGKQPPPSFDDAVLRTLTLHRGKKQAISRVDLVAAVSRELGAPIHERVVRETINSLRKLGWTICSAGGGDGGYWLAADWDELNEYIENELHSRAMDLLEQEKALKARAEQMWGRYSPQKQYRLGI